MKKAIWISYYVGVRGDYEGLYTWLDSKDAVECGDSLAFIKYESDDDIIDSLKKEVEDAVEITKKMRIYVIYHDDETNKIKGKFLVGARKAAPWAGFAGKYNSEDEDEV